jgi:hypothetical protein
LPVQKDYQLPCDLHLVWCQKGATIVVEPGDLEILYGIELWERFEMIERVTTLIASREQSNEE